MLGGAGLGEGGSVSLRHCVGKESYLGALRCGFDYESLLPATAFLSVCCALVSSFMDVKLGVCGG